MSIPLRPAIYQLYQFLDFSEVKTLKGMIQLFCGLLLCYPYLAYKSLEYFSIILRMLSMTAANFMLIWNLQMHISNLLLVN